MSITLLQAPQNNFLETLNKPNARQSSLERTGKIASALGLGGAMAFGIKQANDHAWFGENLVNRGDIPAIGIGVGLSASSFLALSLSGKMFQKDEDLLAVGLAALGTAAGVGSTVSFAKAFNSNYWVGAAVTLSVIGVTHLIAEAASN